MDKNIPIQPDVLAAAAEEALAGEPVTSVLQIDLDDFLGLNEEAGREGGDRVLAAAASVLESTAKKEGWSVVRVGGDEFSVVAPGLPLEKAFLRAEALRQELGAAMTKAAPNGRRATASVGVANAPRDAKSGPELLRKADLALYSAKEQGGDAVGLTPGDEMVLKSSYYSVAQLGRLKSLAERLKTKEAVLLREGLDDLLRKYDRS
jgi:diguanylate cyclase (GGDEF)-like protein